MENRDCDLLEILFNPSCCFIWFFCNLQIHPHFLMPLAAVHLLLKHLYQTATFTFLFMTHIWQRYFTPLLFFLFPTVTSKLSEHFQMPRCCLSKPVFLGVGLNSISNIYSFGGIFLDNLLLKQPAVTMNFKCIFLLLLFWQRLALSLKLSTLEIHFFFNWHHLMNLMLRLWISCIYKYNQFWKI